MAAVSGCHSDLLLPVCLEEEFLSSHCTFDLNKILVFLKSGALSVCKKK